MRHFILRPLASAFLGMALLGPTQPVRADESGAKESDHAQAYAALLRGDIRPLDQVLAAAGRALVGEIVGVELEHEDGRWIYEIKVVDSGGKLVELLFDAKTAALVGSETE